jgi:hypothetical protein
VALCLGSFAQKSVSVPLAKKADISEIVSLGDNGFVIKTAVGYAGREKNIQIHSFTSDMQKRWTVVLDKPTNTMLHYTLLASPYSSYTYYIQMSKVFTASKGVINITRIDSTGKKKEIKYKVSKEFDNSDRVAMFADDNALYFLNYEQKVNSKRDVKKGKAQNKKESTLVMYSLKVDKTTMERHVTDLQMTSASQNEDLFVEYLGHDEDHIYLSRKSVDLSENALKYEVFTLDKSFTTIDVSEFEAKMESPLVPSVNNRTYKGAEIYNNDYDVEVTHRGNTIITTYIANAGSFGCAYLDIENGHLYVYGLTGLKPVSKSKSKKKENALITGARSAYICKFDFNTSEILEQKEFELPKEMLVDKSFADPYLFVNRSIWMDLVDQNTYRFCGTGSGEDLHVAVLSVGDKKASYIGKKIEFRRNSGTYHRRFLANALGNKSYMSDEYMKFIKKYPDFRTKDYSIFAIYLGDRTVVVRNLAFTKDPRLEFNLFKHKGAETEN